MTSIAVEWHNHYNLLINNNNKIPIQQYLSFTIRKKLYSYKDIIDEVLVLNFLRLFLFCA